MSAIDPNQVAKTPLPGANAPDAIDPQGRPVGERDQPATGAAKAAASSFVPSLARPIPSAQRTVTLGKVTNLQNSLPEGEKGQAGLAIQIYCEGAAKCQKAFKMKHGQLPQFQGFVNGYVGTKKLNTARLAIGDAYEDYKACGLEDVSAKEIKAGIETFAGGIKPESLAAAGYNELVAAGNFEDAFEKYLDAALEAYPGLFTDGERRALQEDIVG
ncbi:MAG: hypothetical protein LBE99_00305, partial [Puniceicoccales bacterium]|nr:hypothetical protein [Puniceicoccales bacterium]